MTISQESDHPTGGRLVPFQFHRRHEPRRPRGIDGDGDDGDVPVLAPGAGEGADDGAGHGDVAGTGTVGLGRRHDPWMWMT